MSLINLNPSTAGLLPNLSTIQLTSARAIVNQGPSSINSFSDLPDIDLTNLHSGSFLQWDSNIRRWVAINTILATSLESMPANTVSGRTNGVGPRQNLSTPELSLMVISTSANNRLSTGVDGNLFVNELNVNLVEHYNQAKL